MESMTDRPQAIEVMGHHLFQRVSPLQVALSGSNCSFQLNVLSFDVSQLFHLKMERIWQATQVMSVVVGFRASVLLQHEVLISTRCKVVSVVEKSCFGWDCCAVLVCEHFA